jgi:hypothetical protein
MVSLREGLLHQAALLSFQGFHAARGPHLHSDTSVREYVATTCSVPSATATRRDAPNSSSMRTSETTLKGRSTPPPDAASDTTRFGLAPTHVVPYRPAPSRSATSDTTGWKPGARRAASSSGRGARSSMT